ncbi:L,D-transpeptidase family protein [Pseudomonas sp. CCI3.1]|uniref:L,D-transpeptidase family protein n=1 Tax=Pseudomonas sp. CCI3.1 TaxID=3048618 RepID=UPI002AB563A5|nr:MULTISPECIES: L,D-transpeptidase family protein [unclassified Pseudomonas]MDY7580199.1 L,D-transpeptidase family protein [Pseudomonas sp. CCI3.1]MEB0068330.1 L,D-transpeptidase family protein [Pseudomonas sp. CCI3.1]MEB0072887.1 L,D-transpeptidase family protein [Pseudomonas sp. CCI1.4]
MFKKRAFYLSIALLTAPLVAVGDPLPVSSLNPVQQALSQLPQDCPGLAARVSESSKQLLQGFYLGHNDQLVWTDNQRLSALQAALAQLADDGLNPGDYTLPSTRDLCADIETSQQYLQALQDLHYGRLPQAKFEPVWHASEVPQDRQARILALAGPGLNDIPRAFDQARPQGEMYQNLRRVYARQRLQPLPQWQPLASGPLLRPGMQDARVPELAKRLFSEGYLNQLPASVDHTYTNELAAAVKSFQLDHSLQADGVIGAGTLKELNISPQERLEQLRINLERFRWIAQDFEPDSLLVNVPAAQLTVYQSGVPVWQTRTQVGRAERQTPLLKSRVNRLTLNPTWTIPPTIFREDKLPQIRRDPSFLSRQDLQIVDSNGQPLAAQDIDWDRPGNILLRQGAGPRNPLGRIAIRFPNPFSVYLHDTPSQALFSKGPRAFSSGCVRVESVFQLRDLLVTPAEKTRTEELLSTGLTHEFRLSRPVPILMTYWTAQASKDGKVTYAPDIYNHDPALISALAGKK